jgi:hypothetical protein
MKGQIKYVSFIFGNQAVLESGAAAKSCQQIVQYTIAAAETVVPLRIPIVRLQAIRSFSRPPEKRAIFAFHRQAGKNRTAAQPEPWRRIIPAKLKESLQSPAPTLVNAHLRIW